MKLPIAKTAIQVRFSDLDALLHVSNCVYSEYLELGRIDWFGQIPGERRAAVVASIKIDFLGEIRFEDDVEVVTHCSRVGTKSVHLEQKIYANERHVTDAIVVMVGFDPATRTTVPLLPGWEATIPDGG